MSGSLFLLGADDTLKPMAASAFETEDIFQELLARFPALLTDTDFGEGTPRRWLLVKREVSIADTEGGSGRWSLDHLFLDQDGVPTLVEIKRATDTRVRREVVAQMLDYAANAARWWKAEQLSSLFVEQCRQSGQQAENELGKLLDTSEPDVEAYWRSVQANLGSGRIRMIFVADRIPPELERIVEFLNEQMSPATVAALELRPYSNGADRILAPRLIGLTVRSKVQKSIGSSSAAMQTEEAWREGIGADFRRVTERFLALVETKGATVRVAGQPLAVDVDSSGARIAYVRQNGRIALSCWMLRKTEAYKEEPARAALVEGLEGIGFTLASRKPTGDNAFDLPSMDQEQKWIALDAFFGDLIRAVA